MNPSHSMLDGVNVGQGDYVVKPGDCIESIAIKAGLFWETIWTDQRNRELRQVRKDPNILLPGDRVSFDPVRPKHASGTTNSRHRFRRRGIPSLLWLQILDLANYQDANDAPAIGSETAEANPNSETPSAAVDDPPQGIPYNLEVDGKWFSGETDPEGNIHQAIPPNARSGRLILAPGTPFEMEYELDLGHLDPLTDLSGVRGRLANLGWSVEEAEDEENLASALAAFQESCGLEPTGNLDDETRSRLQETHGS